MLLSSALLFIFATLPFNVIAEGPTAECHRAYLGGKQVISVPMGGEWPDGVKKKLIEALKGCIVPGSELDPDQEPGSKQVFMGVIGSDNPNFARVGRAIYEATGQIDLFCEEAKEGTEHYKTLEEYDHKKV